MNYISNKIKSFMILKNISHERLLELTKLNRFQLDNVLHGRSKKIELISKIAKALEVSLDFLCDPITSNSNKVTINTNIIQLELLLYINFYCEKYKINLSEVCKTKIVNLFRNHQSDDNLRKEVINMIHGIFFLLRENPKLVEYLSV